MTFTPPPSDPDHFCVPVGPGGGLAAVAAALARRLATLGTTAHTAAVFVSVVGRPETFTQCLVDVDKGAWVECVSNHYLPEHLTLTDIDERLLRQAGFTAPDDFSPNFHLVVPQPVDWYEVAMMMAVPFAMVFDCAEHAQIEVRIRPEFAEREDDEDWELEAPDEGDDAVA